MSLSKLRHQPHAHRVLQRALRHGRVPHAYLFHGPDGVGKEFAAVGLGKLLLCSAAREVSLECERRDEYGVASLREACDRCDDCRAVEHGVHPDFHLVYRQLNREHPDPAVRKRKGLDLGVDVLRHFLIERVNLTPNRGRAKVFVIREADAITPQAQNALLKTLEEPPGTTYLILLVASLDRVLETTQSRCQVVRFHPLPCSFLAEHLAASHAELPPEQLAWYAATAEGSLGATITAMQDELYAWNERVVEQLIEIHAAKRDSPTGLALAHDWIESAKELGERHRKRDPDVSDTEAMRRGLQTILRLVATWEADLLRAAAGNRDNVCNSHRLAQVSALAKGTPSRVLIELVNRIAQAEAQLRLNVNVQLCVESLAHAMVRAIRADRATVT